ncbi:MAG: hypothetical protein VKO64_07115 [Candidatus Sericytochromatia bacterium]|nr:hypothetical protein [Candidatus Sericytochromatia bacterium]
MTPVRPPPVQRMLAMVAVLMLSLLQPACATVGPASANDRDHMASTALSGQVRFPQERQAQAYGIRDVALAATVSIIDMGSSETIATTLTNSQGEFNFTAEVTNKLALETPYILEAVKGLSSNAPGVAAVRVRTVFLKASTGFYSMSQGALAITPGTTALSIIAGFEGIDGRLLIDIFLDDGYNLILVPNPDIGVTQAKYDTVNALARQAMGEDRDPVEAIILDAGVYKLKGGAASAINELRLLAMSPNPAPEGGIVTLLGTKLQENGFQTTVKFGTLVTPVLETVANGIKVRVPVGATSGTLSAINASGNATMSINIIPPVSGQNTPTGDGSRLPGGQLSGNVPSAVGGAFEP